MVLRFNHEPIFFGAVLPSRKKWGYILLRVFYFPIRLLKLSQAQKTRESCAETRSWFLPNSYEAALRTIGVVKNGDCYMY